VRPARLFSLILPAATFIALSFSPAPLHAQNSEVNVQAAPPELSAEVTEAEAAIMRSDWKSAQLKLDTWLKSHPNDAHALFDAGYVADALNSSDAAASLYRRSVLADPKSFPAHLSLGLLLVRMGKPAEAKPELVTATTLDPGDLGPEMKARAWRALAEIDRPSKDHAGDLVSASQDLIEALKLTPETPQDTLLAAELAEDAGSYDEAIAIYRKLLKSNPNSAVVTSALAHLLIARKNYDEAESLLRAARDKFPDDPALNAQFATVLAAEDKAEALPVLEKLHADHPDDEAITRMLEQIYATAGDYPNSDKLCLKLLATKPNDAILLVDHGQNLIHLLQYPAALAAFDKAAKLDATNADAWNGLAFAASRTQQPRLTLEALSKRSALLPDNPATYFLWATAYDELHDKSNAARSYHQFLDSSAGKFPNQEFQARQRLKLLEQSK
jgi:predicted Zn-dependent protease